MIENIKKNDNAVIIFHKNILNIYKKEWINQSIESVLDQNNIKFDIFEINYGNSNYSVLNDYKNKLLKLNCGYFFYSENFDNHVEAMVFLINKIFNEYKYKIIFNTNIDDYYDLNRFKSQVDCINDGFDVCSSLYEYIDSENNLLNVYTHSDLKCGLDNDKKYLNTEDIKKRLIRGGNIINHSGVCITKKFWESYDSDRNLLRYRNDKPFEDFTLWRRALSSNIKISILNQILISYRIHSNQITTNNTKYSFNPNMDQDFKKEPNFEKRRIGVFLYCLEKEITELSNYLENIQKYFLTRYRKIFFIITDNKNIIIENMKSYNYEYYITNIIINKELINIHTCVNYFYPKIELVCDLLYWIPLKTNISCNYTHILFNLIDKPYIRYISDTTDIFGAVTHYYLEFAKSGLDINDFLYKNISLFKIIDKRLGYSKINSQNELDNHDNLLIDKNIINNKSKKSMKSTKSLKSIKSIKSTKFKKKTMFEKFLDLIS